MITLLVPEALKALHVKARYLYYLGLSGIDSPGALSRAITADPDAILKTRNLGITAESAILKALQDHESRSGAPITTHPRAPITGDKVDSWGLAKALQDHGRARS